MSRPSPLSKFVPIAYTASLSKNPKLSAASTLPRSSSASEGHGCRRDLQFMTDADGRARVKEWSGNSCEVAARGPQADVEHADADQRVTQQAVVQHGPASRADDISAATASTSVA